MKRGGVGGCIPCCAASWFTWAEFIGDGFSQSEAESLITRVPERERERVGGFKVKVEILFSKRIDEVDRGCSL